MSAVEDRLHEALFEGAAAVDESPDLFARVRLSIEDDRRLRRQRRRAAGIAASIAGAVGALTAAVTDYRQGELLMDWWVLEALTNALFVGLALWLGLAVGMGVFGYAVIKRRLVPRLAGLTVTLALPLAAAAMWYGEIRYSSSGDGDDAWFGTPWVGSVVGVCVLAFAAGVADLGRWPGRTESCLDPTE